MHLVGCTIGTTISLIHTVMLRIMRTYVVVRIAQNFTDFVYNYAHKYSLMCWNNYNSTACLFKWLEIIHVFILFNSLCANFCSSLVQTGSIPCMMHIVWRAVSDCTVRLYSFAQHLAVCISTERLNSSAGTVNCLLIFDETAHRFLREVEPVDIKIKKKKTFSLMKCWNHCLPLPAISASIRLTFRFVIIRRHECSMV